MSYLKILGARRKTKDLPVMEKLRLSEQQKALTRKGICIKCATAEAARTSYLFDTYAYIQQRLTEAQRRLERVDDQPHDKSHAAGQIQALCDFERFLIDNFNVKLPRRLRSKVPNKGR
jgi:hypothetical protein